MQDADVNNTLQPSVLTAQTVRRKWLGLPIVALLLSATAASAHGTNPGMVLMRLSADTVYITATPLMTVFKTFDDNTDGLISRKELKRHRAEMLEQFKTLLTLRGPGVRIVKTLLGDISSSHIHRKGQNHLRVTLRYKLNKAPEWLDLYWALGKVHAMKVLAQRMTPGKLAKQRPVGPKESGRLDSEKPRMRLFVHTKQ